jgi:hypothetical protein
MPEFLATAFVNVALGFGASAGTAIAVGAFVANYGLLLGGLALSASSQRSAKRKARDQFNAAQQDRLVNISSTVAPRELVLGRVRKGGAPFFRGSTGPNKTTFVMLVALAGHEIDAVETVYLNDVPVSLDGSGNVTTAPYSLTSTYSYTDYGGTLTYTPIAGTDRYFTGSTGGPEGDLAECTSGDAWNVATYQYSSTTSNANIRAVTGTDSQTADATLSALFPGVWTSAHRARGVAYLICTFQYSETAFPTGLPVVTATIRGAKCYDPRTGLTVWTENPALHMRHVYQHAAFGKATVTAAEDARITTAANACDTSTVYTVGGVAQAARALYKSGIVASYGAAPKDLFDDLSQAMAGSWAFAGGEMYVKAGTHTASVMSLTEADLAVVVRDGASESMVPISIAVHKERAQKFNTVAVQIWDAAQDYKQVTLTPLIGSALVTRDGATLTQAVTYAAIGYAPQALHVAGVMMRDARDPLTVVIPFKLKAYPLELFDTVALTISRYGWSSKLFTVLGREFGSDGSLKLTLKETAASIFTMDAAFSAQGGAANTSMPSPWYVAPITPLTVTSGTAELTRQADGTVVSRMRVTWPLPNDASITMAGTVEVQYRNVLTETWTTVQVSGSETQVLISDVADDTFYAVRARARNRQAVGDWGAQVVHRVVGKSELPTTVTGVATTQDLALWTPVTDLDLAGYEIRAIPGSTGTWALGVPLHSGLVTSTPYTYIQRLTGVQTVMVAARDTSGIYGVHGSATLDFGTIDALNVAQSYDYAAAGFPGPETTNATVSGTDLLADADPSTDWWAVGPDWWGYGGGTDFYGGSLYLQSTYIATFAPTYSGSVVLDTTLIGAPTSIEWRVDGSLLGDFWDSGGADFWDGSTFYGEANSWQPYIGEVGSTAGVTIQWRVIIGAGPVQGQITDMSVRLQMPQIAQVFTALAIDAGGTRLTPANGSPAQSWISVEQVDFTVYVDGSGAVAGRVIDFDPTLGPLVQTINAAGTAVSSTGQAARVSGF